MPKETNTQQGRIDQFFSGPGARADHWRDLQDQRAGLGEWHWQPGRLRAAFAEMAVLEEFHAYPGAHLLNALEDLAATDDARATAALVTRISSALLSRSFRRNGADWDAREDSDPPCATCCRRHWAVATRIGPISKR